jgi:3-mercaptopyruvate sulfurtransferase SseA
MWQPDSDGCDVAVHQPGGRSMKWKQFLTPVSSINWEEAHELMQHYPSGDVTFLDVRQPREYEERHMPGAKLVPLGELADRLDELDGDKPIVIY